MRRLVFPAALCGLLIASPPVHAAAVEYGTAHGWGTLLLDRAARTVTLDAIGANGHTCTVRGHLASPTAQRVEAEDGCSFQLQAKPQGVLGVVVDLAAREACRSQCGARAWFEGDYLPLPAECTLTGLARRQHDALQAYRAQQFEGAYQRWTEGLARCEATMTWSAIWGWRNDAAIAAWHAQRPQDCLRLSQTVLAEAQTFTLPGDTEPFGAAPSDADVARPLLAAARHNLAKCSAARP